MHLFLLKKLFKPDGLNGFDVQCIADATADQANDYRNAVRSTNKGKK